MSFYHGFCAPKSLTLWQCMAAGGLCCKRGRGFWAGSAPVTHTLAGDMGHSYHLCPCAGGNWLPGPSPSKQPPQPPPCHLLAKHPPHLPKFRAYSHLPGWLQLQKRSRCFLPSLTQPKTPAPLCPCWDAGSGILVG